MKHRGIKNVMIYYFTVIIVVVVVIGLINKGFEETQTKLKQEKERLTKFAIDDIAKANDELKKQNQELKLSRGVKPLHIAMLGKSNIDPDRLERFLASNPNSNLVGLGNSFLAAEHETSVNAIPLTAIAVHESAWGTNQITAQKNNILSIAAYDWSPLSSASAYETKTHCILAGARLLKRDYLIEGGQYYNGATLDGINVKYATDKTWASKVRKFIEQIANTY
jgi:beta-N-acetylglucosaminidase